MAESAPPNAESAPMKSDEFWFEDGDIVLSVTEDGIETHFRIHRAILTIPSPVFRDMLSMPQPPECENLPVRLQDDSPHDVKALLGALYYARKRQTQLTFDIMLGILRLSHKYQMDGLQQEMRLKLEKDWPVKFPDLMARRSDLGPSLVYNVSQATALIETAQRCQADELLPAAFYELACAWGTRREEIIRALSPENVARLSVGHARSEQRLRAIQTSSSDLMWHPFLASEERTIFQHRLNFPQCGSSPNSKPTYCYGIIQGFRSKIALLLLDGIFAIPAIQQCERSDLGDGCKHCKDWFMDVLKSRIEELWNKIPTYFNLSEVDSSDAISRSVKRRKVG